MQLSAERHTDVVVLRVSGRIDHANAESFRVALEPHLDGCRADGDSLVLDLAGLQYISSAGLRVLMLAAKRAKPAGGRIAVAAAPPLVHEVLDITRFNLVFPIHETIEGAITALAATPPSGAERP